MELLKALSGMSEVALQDLGTTRYLNLPAMTYHFRGNDHGPQKNSISHRARAIVGLMEFLDKI